MLCGCSFSIKNCELEPGAEIDDVVTSDKPIQDQVTPKADINCTF